MTSVILAVDPGAARGPWPPPLRVFVGVVGACFALFALFSAGCTTLVETTVVVGTAAIPEAGAAIPEAGAVGDAGPEASTEAGTEAGTEASTEAGTEASTDAGPEASTEASTAAIPDAGAGTDARCTPETDAVFCAWYSDGGCSSFSGFDSCGVLREAVVCGNCPAACTPETDTAFCARLGKNCGTVTAADNCGASRTASCGTCGSANPICQGNLCVCRPESDAAFCAAWGVSCGTAYRIDNCGLNRTAQCGYCTNQTTCIFGECAP